MPLSLNYTKITNWEELCYLHAPDHPDANEDGIIENPFNVAMGLMLMHVGMFNITHANADQFYTRAKVVEACIGAIFTNGDGSPRYITPKDVHDYIGLESNNSRRTPAWFYKHLRDDLMPALKSVYLAYVDDREEEVRERVKATVAADPTLSKLEQQ